MSKETPTQTHGMKNNTIVRSGPEAFRSLVAETQPTSHQLVSKRCLTHNQFYFTARFLHLLEKVSSFAPVAVHPNDARRYFHLLVWAGCGIVLAHGTIKDAFHEKVLFVILVNKIQPKLPIFGNRHGPH